MSMLEFEEYKGKLNTLKPALDDLQDALHLEEAKREIAELQEESAQDGFWNNVSHSQQVQQRIKQLQTKCEKYDKLCSSWDDLFTMCEMALEEDDASMLEELKAEYNTLSEKLEEMRLSTLLTGEYDANNAILTFHAGAGGTEAQDWTQMLYRMYTMLDGSPRLSSIRCSTIRTAKRPASSPPPSRSRGDNAYGYLKSENGVHRLVRISPYDASGRRHTSFAAAGGHARDRRGQQRDRAAATTRCKMDVYRSSGAGGQKVNKTSSAVRLTHLPTGHRRLLRRSSAASFQNLENCKSMLRCQARRDQGARASRKDLGHQGRAAEDRVGQPDPLVRLHAVYARQGPRAPVMKTATSRPLWTAISTASSTPISQ